MNANPKTGRARAVEASPKTFGQRLRRSPSLPVHRAALSPAARPFADRLLEAIVGGLDDLPDDAVPEAAEWLMKISAEILWEVGADAAEPGGQGLPTALAKWMKGR